MNKIIIAILVGAFLLFASYQLSKQYFLTPEIDLKNIIVSKNGSEKAKSLSDLKGKVTLVAFFQTWCIDCIKEMPTILILTNEVKNSDFKVIMVTDESVQKLEHFKNKFPDFNFDFYISKQKLPDFGVKKYPTTYLLNEKGEEIKSTLEGYDWGKVEIVNLVDRELKK